MSIGKHLHDELGTYLRVAWGAKILTCTTKAEFYRKTNLERIKHYQIKEFGVVLNVRKTIFPSKCSRHNDTINFKCHRQKIKRCYMPLLEHVKVCQRELYTALKHFLLRHKNIVSMLSLFVIIYFINESLSYHIWLTENCESFFTIPKYCI